MRRTRLKKNGVIKSKRRRCVVKENDETTAHERTPLPKRSPVYTFVCSPDTWTKKERGTP
eukprot:2787978-Pleurochrysis_carterae.AAC.2